MAVRLLRSIPWPVLGSLAALALVAWSFWGLGR